MYNAVVDPGFLDGGVGVWGVVGWVNRRYFQIKVPMLPRFERLVCLK